MRFTTIWGRGFGMGLGERLLRTRDWFFMNLAWRMPLRLKYWVTIHMIGKATMESPNVPASDVSYILNHMPHPKVVR